LVVGEYIPWPISATFEIDISLSMPPYPTDAVIMEEIMSADPISHILDVSLAIEHDEALVSVGRAIRQYPVNPRTRLAEGHLGRRQGVFSMADPQRRR
jgi:hypothetical protein